MMLRAGVGKKIADPVSSIHLFRSELEQHWHSSILNNEVWGDVQTGEY